MKSMEETTSPRPLKARGEKDEAHREHYVDQTAKPSQPIIVIVIVIANVTIMTIITIIIIIITTFFCSSSVRRFVGKLQWVQRNGL